jgi:hypothetical protein
MSTLPPLPTKNKGGDQASGLPALPWQPRKTSHPPVQWRLTRLGGSWPLGASSCPLSTSEVPRGGASAPPTEKYLQVAHSGQLPVPGTPLGRPGLHRERLVVRGNSVHRIRERWLKPLRKQQSGECGKRPGTRPGPVLARQQSPKGQRYIQRSLLHPAENQFVAVSGSMTTANDVMLPKGCRGLLGLNG